MGFKQLLANFLGRFSSIMFFLITATVVILFPLLLFALPILLIPLLLHKYIMFHKAKYHALEAENEVSIIVSDEAAAQIIDFEGWKKYQYPDYISYPASDFADINPVGLINSRKAREQIADVNARRLSEITDLLPYGASTVQYFTEVSPHKWVYTFHSYALKAEFNAVTYGQSPDESFTMARAILLQQIREWHQVRDTDQPYVGPTNEELINEIRGLSQQSVISADTAPEKLAKHQPSILIIEDDPEVAQATANIFKQLGCLTTISNGHDGVSYKMSFQNFDFIVLDWMLGDNLFGDQVVQKSVKIIDLFNDLKDRFEHNQPKIITYSVLDRPEINLPTNNYFYHLDHWKKPSKYTELVEKASGLIAANAN